ncbi:hypothetical protein ABBQ38_002405 [Trebouxia sp. C0009 RCD-2024]
MSFSGIASSGAVFSFQGMLLPSSMPKHMALLQYQAARWGSIPASYYLSSIMEVYWSLAVFEWYTTNFRGGADWLRPRTPFLHTYRVFREWMQHSPQSENSGEPLLPEEPLKEGRLKPNHCSYKSFRKPGLR